MSKPRSIVFKKEHIELMDIREHEWKLISSNTRILAAMEYIENQQCAVTIVHKGVVLAVAGYIEISQGVFEVWVIPSQYLSDNSMAFARLMCYYKNEILSKFDWHRLQIIALDDNLHNRWVKFLGFELEGKLRQWNADKQNFNIWSIVR